MQIILFMTLSGSLLFLMISLIFRLKRDIFDQNKKYEMLKICLFMHFLPLPVFIFFIKSLAQKIIPENILNTMNTAYYGDEKIFILGSNTFASTKDFFYEFSILGLWIFVSVLILIFQIYKYMKCKNIVLKTSYEVKDTEILDILHKYVDKLDIKKQNICIYKTNANVSPFKMGVLNPIIIIPNIDDDFRIETAICHELCHIKNNDGIFIFLRNIMLIIYWFNPVVYYISKSLVQSSELVCDKMVTEGMDKNERFKYASFIIDAATMKLNSKYSNALKDNSSEKTIKERLDYIMKTTKVNKKLSGVIVATVICAVSITPAFAYDAPRVLKFEGTSDIVNNSLKSDNDFSEFADDSHIEDIELNKVIHSSFFKADDGAIYEYSGETEPQWFCKHSYVDGVFRNHITDSKGGCTMYYYEDAKRCKKCGVINTGELTYKTIYTKCPH